MPQVRIGWRSGTAAAAAPSVSATLLDSYSGAAAAYSLRKLRTGYTGSAIRVRRSSDNTEQNIGFDSNGNLDTYALSAFVGTGSGFVTIWYDQSGNSRDATQTTAGNQPQIVSNGVVNTFNSKPCVKFDGSNDFIQSPYATGTSNELYFVTQTTDTCFLFPRGITGYGFVADQGNTSTNTSSYFTTPTQLYVNSVLSSPANRGAVYNLLNGYKLSVHKGADISNNFNYLRFGSFIQDGNFDFNGNLFEWIIYPTLQSSQSSIESNINSYYSVYPNPTSVWNLLAAAYNADTTALPSLKTSLVAAYNGESNANDSFGSNNGTAMGGLTYTAGKIGNAFNFNGTTSYLSIPNVSNQLNFQDDFSISLWFNPLNTTSQYQVLFTNRSSTATNGGYVLYYERGSINKLRFEIQNGSNFSSYESSFLPSANTWYHLTITRKKSTITKMYINGNLVSGSYNYLGGAANIDPLYQTGQIYSVGSYGTTTLSAFAEDAINVWSKELTQSEITELYNSGNGAQYIGDNFYKPTTNDALNTYNGTAQGGLTYGLGKVGTAFSFNGTNAYVELGDVMDVGTSSWSYTFWFKTFDAVNSGICFSKSFAGGNSGRFWGGPYNNRFAWNFQAGSNVICTETNNGTILPNTWYHVVCVLDRNDKLKLYINGTLASVNVTSGTNNLTPYLSDSFNTTHPFRIGAYTDSNNITPYGFFKGQIDSFSVWNRVLTQSEVTELYNSGNGKQYPN